PPPTALHTRSLHDALPILRHGKAQRGHRIVAGRMHHLDHEIDIAIGLRPAPLRIMEPVWPVAARLQAGNRTLHVRHPTKLRAPKDRKSTRLNSSHVKISYA